MFFGKRPQVQTQWFGDNKLGRRREGASSLLIYCTSNAGHGDKILLACPAHSYVGVRSTATNVRALRLSVAKQHQHQH